MGKHEVLNISLREELKKIEVEPRITFDHDRNLQVSLSGVETEFHLTNDILRSEIVQWEMICFLYFESLQKVDASENLYLLFCLEKWWTLQINNLLQTITPRRDEECVRVFWSLACVSNFFGSVLGIVNRPGLMIVGINVYSHTMRWTGHCGMIEWPNPMSYFYCPVENFVALDYWQIFIPLNEHNARGSNSQNQKQFESIITHFNNWFTSINSLNNAYEHDVEVYFHS